MCFYKLKERFSLLPFKKLPYNCYIVLKYIVFCIKNVASLFKYVKILQLVNFPNLDSQWMSMQKQLKTNLNNTTTVTDANLILLTYV